MNFKRVFSVRLAALLISLALLLTGCVGPISFPELSSDVDPSQSETETANVPTSTPTVNPTVSEPVTEPSTEPATEPTEQTVAPTEEPKPENDPMIRWKNAGHRDYLPDEPVEMIPFSEMEYVRPDVATLYADFDALTEQAKTSSDAAGLLSTFYGLYDRYVSFHSMSSLANILYSLDTTVSYYQDEYNYCDDESSNLEEKLEALYKAFAASPSRNELETQYFGEGFFEKYDDYEIYTNPEYLRLSHEESALLTEYRDITADKQVTYNGETKPLDEWLQTKDYDVYMGALQAYYDEYNASLGDIYVRLVKVRQQLAAALDYDSYAEYAYDVTYSRDYTPEDGTAFLEGIRNYLLPVMNNVHGNYSYYVQDSGSSMEKFMQEMLSSAAEKIGGSVWDAYQFMRRYELCDISKSPRKLEASFQTYLYDYEAPFVFLNSRGDGKDLITFAHEFGHFTDAYHNYGAEEDLETAETFSQSMEFLALTYTDSLSQQQKEKLLKYELSDVLNTFVNQGCFADFEARVYALPVEEITLDNINGIFLQCCKDYGFYVPGFDFYYAKYWIDVLHFFEVPYYIISYCVSAETALQVYRLETETPHAGVDAYFRLLDRDYEAGVQKIMEDAGLESPFREGVLEQTAAFFREKLD